MSSIKPDAIDATSSILASLPPAVRVHLERIAALPPSRAEVIDLMLAQQAVNVAISKTMVSLAGGERDEIFRNLREVQELLEKNVVRTGEALGRLLSDPDVTSAAEFPK